MVEYAMWYPQLKFLFTAKCCKISFSKSFSVLLRMRQLKKVWNNFIVLKVRLKLYHVIIALQETWIEWTKCNFFLFKLTSFVHARTIIYSILFVCWAIFIKLIESKYNGWKFILIYGKSRKILTYFLNSYISIL